jgi:fatty-acyl-CoA synthase
MFSFSVSEFTFFIRGGENMKEKVYIERRLTESYWSGDTGDELLDTTVPYYLRKNAAEVPDRLALVEGIADVSKRRKWTYAELLTNAEKVAAALLKRFNPGDRCAIMAPNIVEWVLFQYGCAVAGIYMVTLNPAYQVREIGHILKQAEVAGIFTVKEYRGNKLIDTVNGLRPKLSHLKEVVDLAEFDAFVNSSKQPADFPEVKPEDPCVIMFTSGTTGTPKGAVLNHRGMTNSTRYMAIRSGLPEGGVWINMMPMYHMGGCGFAALGTLQQAGTHVIGLEFNAKLFLDLVESAQGVYALLVPTMLEAILDYPDIKKYDISTLKFIQSGASKVEVSLVRRVKDELGCSMSIVCGQTEAHGGYTQTHLDDSPEDQSETIGQPYPLIDFKIGDRKTGEVLPIGQEGEICLRGYQVMVEYYNDPQGTAVAIDKDGWLHSGDLGVMDERGFVRFTGRLKDLIIRGGINIYPAEVEKLLAEHPKVAKVAVVGVPDEYWGEQVAACIIGKSCDDLLTVEELNAYCLESLARFKRPRLWAFTKEFPCTATGKLRKFQLKEDILNGVLKCESTVDKKA